MTAYIPAALRDSVPIIVEAMVNAALPACTDPNLPAQLGISFREQCVIQFENEPAEKAWCHILVSFDLARGGTIVSSCIIYEGWEAGAVAIFSGRHGDPMYHFNCKLEDGGKWVATQSARAAV